jgi:hypothetical protein
MKKMLEKLNALNLIDLVGIKFIIAATDTMKTNPEKSEEYERYAKALSKVGEYISEIVDELDAESKHNLNLSRVVAVQEIELEQLRNKVKLLENEINFREL